MPVAPKEDSWAFQPIGSPFPEAPVRVPNQNNQYVALWYKHGKPIHGRAWNNDGVVECSFPYNKAELKGKLDLGGQIQILQYKGDYSSLGYWYEWLPLKQRHENNEGIRELVRCGNSVPVLAKLKDGTDKLGFLDLNTEIALFSNAGTTEKYEGGATANFMTIFRNLRPPPTGLKVYDDLWYDLRYGDTFPANAVPADGRALNTETGPHMQYVALWYKHGDPVFGRAYPNSAGKTNAHFGKNNQENAGPEVGSMQLLTVPEASCMGLEYKWMPLAEGKSSGWTVVHIGNAAPCILKDEKGLEVLGNLDLTIEKASAGYGGKEKIMSGASVAGLKVLFKRRLA
ncbi:hypothetical protein CAEBREN_12290 [Caenorhabditis brenneri]|uniref:Uncharacterized protein n=1 Tax=Caenorhabditis brenneri TaxID=135651 RepID=G0PBN3_CAEBE|nr:hypothetical protein CAEBREN_12290 [Caenorhabditis brenneri]